MCYKDLVVSKNNIITTEVRINKLESMECIGASKTFIDLQSGITEQLCTFKDAGFDVTSVVQASTISELYHELWVLFKKMRSKYWEPYVGNDDKEETESLVDKIYEIEKCLNLIQDVYYACEDLENELKESMKYIWNKYLTDVTISCELDTFHLIVSISKTNDLRPYTDNRKIISCSYFSNKSPWLFKNDCVGFCYDVNNKYLIGMSPCDCGLAGTVVRNENEEMYRLVYDGIKVNDGVYLNGVLYDFMPYYLPRDLQKSGSYSEVVLRGDADPVAIYEPLEQLKSNYSNIIAASALYKLPIVIYNKAKNNIKILQSVDSVNGLPDLNIA